MRITDSTGRERPELTVKQIVRGQATLVVPLALDDPKGKWTVRARDIITGQELVLTFLR